MGRKELLALISSIMAFTALGIDLMLPAFDEIREDFQLGLNSTETSRVITVYLLGMAFGQLLYGPIADRFGRKKALYTGAMIYIFGAIFCVFAGTFNELLAGRFIWGIGAAGARVVATSIIRDRFEGAAMASAMSNVMAVFVLVPIVSPSIGAVIISIAPWRAVFWSCVVFAIVVVVWSLRLRETLDPANRRPLSPGAIAGGYWKVASTPVTFGYTISTIFIQASFTSYLASSELLISEVFDREAQFPVIFGGVAIFFGVAALINGRVVLRLGIDRVVNRGFVVIGLLLTALVLVTLMSSGTPNFWLFMPILGLALSSFMFLMPNLNSAAMDPLGQIAGSGSALTGAVRVAGGAVLGGFISERVDTSVTPLVIGMTAMVALAGIAVWLVRGGGIRSILQ
ncbi:MAG: DHA1 family bicyclomycin/chloramphenicol resistance-like MFS transporter [Verrucomicrobiales bacterium]|jgi:DHA1 family bicyclomycin/chloramphenicol resistance-like MFS transporter